MSQPTYFRRDVEGLRGIGVLGVVLFHLNVPGFEGGYAGVDVFFVVSGYVITQLLRRMHAEGRLSYWDFVKRRIRRLFPALGMTLLLSLLGTAFFLPDALHADAATSAWAALLAVSNFYFESTTDYFSPGAIDRPLHHTWSLGVEEQFYLLWPWCIWVLVVWRLPNKRGFLLTLLAAIACACVGSEVALRINQQTAFFLPHARAFEFMLGALCAFAEREAMPLWIRKGAFALGMAGILLTFALYDARTPFPGLRALLPTVGTALVIAAGAPAPFGYLLENRTVAWLGRVSYSVYLVHWPLIVFYWQGQSAIDTWTEQLALGAASIAIGGLSARFVERPFRYGKAREPGIMGRYFPGFVVIDAEHCLESSPDKKDILFVGDSVTASFFYGAQIEAPRDWDLHLAAAASCLPLTYPTTSGKSCSDRNRRIFEELDLSQYEWLIVQGRFENKNDVEAFGDSLRALHERGAQKILVVGSALRYRVGFDMTVAEHASDDPQQVEQALNAMLQPNLLELDHQLRQVCTAAGVEFVSLLELICPHARTPADCEHFLDTGQPIVRDKFHMTLAAAVRYWPFVESRMQP